MISFLKDNAFIVLGILSIVFIIGYGLWRICTRARGSWSTRLSVPASAPPPASAGNRESQGERRARAFLEGYFNRPFNKVRPDFLNNAVTGGKYNLELDCYNDDLKLAVEYNGEQHYKHVPYFHPSKEAFYNQRYRDELKRIYCHGAGVALIEIPYTELSNLEDWLFRQLELKKFTSSDK